MNSQPTKQQEPVYLHEHAAENLRFIRQSMEGSLIFTSVSGQGYVITGLSAVAASWLAARQGSEVMWLSVWLLELALAVSVMLAFTWKKSLRTGEHLFASANGRKLLLAFLPTITAGGVLTLLLVLKGLYSLLPATWLLLYGAAVITAGAHSVKALPAMGAAFFLSGLAAASPQIDTDVLLALAFGGIHISWGTWIWRQYGG